MATKYMTLDDLKTNFRIAAKSANGSSVERRAFLAALDSKLDEIMVKDRWYQVMDQYDRTLMADAWNTCLALHRKFRSEVSEFEVRPFFKYEDERMAPIAEIYAEIVWEAKQYKLA